MEQESNITPRNALKPGYELHWYQIKAVLGQGAFGITYLARDINLDRLVAIKEFLPGQYAMRDGNETVRPVSEEQQDRFSWGLMRFVEEARILDQFEHPNIVRVLNIFEANNTAYMVMRYEQGVSLKEILVRQQFLDESDLMNILFPILDGLAQIHAAGFIHRDIKPANIFVRTDGTPVLLDFGSARQSLQKETHTLTSLVSPGYAPIEQYVSKSDKQGPWTDIYGMAATLYRAVTGVAPADAVTRGEALTGNDQDNLISCRSLADQRYSESFVTAIDHGLAFLTRDRPQSVSDWIKELQPSTGSGEYQKFEISGHISNEVVSVVRDSLTQTVTRINSSSNIPDLWKNEQETNSIELAHKQGFNRGLKAALAVLFLIIGGFFVSNFQKVRQVVQPGYIPQELIETRVEEMTEPESELPLLPQLSSQPEIEPEIQLQPRVESEPGSITGETETSEQADRSANSAELPVIDPAPETESDVSVNSQQVDVIPDATVVSELPPGAILLEEAPERPVPQQNTVSKNREDVIERSSKKMSIVKKAPATETQSLKPTPEVSTTNRKTDQAVVDEKKKVTTADGVTIEEYTVPTKPKPGIEGYKQDIKSWVDYLMNHGEEGSGKGEELRDKLGGKEQKK